MTAAANEARLCECEARRAINEARALIAAIRARPLPRGTFPPAPLVWFDARAREWRESRGLA